jgi:AcrR family transcriptional regulator
MLPAMAGDAEATKRRLLDAATKEFARYGIAGARVDRIAAEARSNKAQIYHYFGSKDELFDAVFNEFVATTLREVPIDPTDLPEYAGRLFDGNTRHPELTRIASWHRLERAGTTLPLESIVKANQSKVDAIAEAQRQGVLTTRYSPADLLALVLTIANMWTAMTPEYHDLVQDEPTAHRRKVVTDAVRALLA